MAVDCVTLLGHLRVVLGLAGENDLVIVGFSGHGVHLDGKSYLCSSEARPDDPCTMIALEDVYARCLVSSSAARASIA